MRHPNTHHRSGRKLWAFWTIGLASLAWLLLRSGTDPRRLSYPCQRAAMAGSAAFVTWVASWVGIAQLYRVLRRKTTLGSVGLLGLTLLLVLAQSASGVRHAQASASATLDLPGWTSPSAVSNVFVAANIAAPQCSLDGGSLPAAPPCNDPATALSDAGVNALVDEMEARGDHFYRTAQHPGGIVAADAVVVIKINNQWGALGEGSGRGRLVTNTDVLKGVVWRILQHPDGFTGEVVVAENTQWVNPNWDTTPANAQDQNQSYADVVNAFRSLGHAVSMSSWDELGENLMTGATVGGGYPPGEYVQGNSSDGYVLVEDPAGGGEDELSYPKFATAGGRSVSLRYGVWDGTSYDADQLALINLPVLKKHGMAGSTIAWKNLIGLVTIEQDTRRYGDWDTMHDFFWGYLEGAERDYGLIGRQLALIRAPDLNIVDAIWVAVDDNTSGSAVRADALVASTDPFAVDWYASEYILRPIAAWDGQGSSAARGGTFRSATRANQNSAASVWPGGSYPYIDLLDGYDGDTPSDNEKQQMNVFLAGTPAACSLTCSATVPGTAAVGETISFQSTATATGCTGQPSFSWDFGDTGSSTQQTATHSYSTPATYGWSLTVTVDDQTCAQQGTVVVGAGASDYDFLVPAVVHAPGESGTQWRTSVACLNLGAAGARLDLTLVTDSGSVTRSVTLDAWSSVEWRDVVVDLFGVSPAASTAGAVHVAADQEILVTSRTYNQGQTGTFGQYLPALSVEHAIEGGNSGILMQLRSDSDFRTNVGFANVGSSACEVAVQLYEAGGDEAGSVVRVTVPAGTWHQVNDVFGAAGAGSHALAFAEVEVVTSGGAVWAYASVVDNHTGDATTIPVL